MNKLKNTEENLKLEGDFHFINKESENIQEFSENKPKKKQNLETSSSEYQINKNNSIISPKNYRNLKVRKKNWKI